MSRYAQDNQQEDKWFRALGKRSSFCRTTSSTRAVFFFPCDCGRKGSLPENATLFWSFPYVCPEPVLVNDHFIEKLDKKAVFAAHLMMSGTRTPASQFVNFCHWPCSPAARKPETKTAFFSDASFSHEKRRRFAKTCSGEGDTQKRRAGNKTKRSGACVCAFAASKQASKQGSTEVPAVIRMEGYDRIVRQAESL